jgi:YD repeat-containing protein
MVKGVGGQVTAVTQYSYDARGRLECSAVRMNFGSVPPVGSDACVSGSQGSFGPDRITRLFYDAAGQLVQERRGLGTVDEVAEVTYAYTDNGKKKYLIDANGNKAELVYDGYDRQRRWSFPATARPTAWNPATVESALASAGAVSAADYELYGYDDNGNRTRLRKRDGSFIEYTYDALNRLVKKDVDATGVRSDLASTYKRDVYYGYDLRGLQLYARFDSHSGEGVNTAYDGFGRTKSTTLAMDGAA